MTYMVRCLFQKSQTVWIAKNIDRLYKISIDCCQESIDCIQVSIDCCQESIDSWRQSIDSWQQSIDIYSNRSIFIMVCEFWNKLRTIHTKVYCYFVKNPNPESSLKLSHSAVPKQNGKTIGQLQCMDGYRWSAVVYGWLPLVSCSVWMATIG